LVGVTSADLDYAALDPPDVSVTNLDNDIAGFTITPTSGLVTGEDGTFAIFTVVLDTLPSAGVTIDLIQSDTPAEGTVDKSSLTFTTGNWNVAQEVTVTGVNDDPPVVDGDVPYTIELVGVTSADPDYAALDPPDVSITNMDDDEAGFTITPSTGLLTTEAGLSDSFDIVLNTFPSDDVTIALHSTDTTEGTIDQSSLTFTQGDWNIPQTITITGVNDFFADEDVLYTIVIDPAVSNDQNYSGIDPDDVEVINSDDETPGFTVTPTNDLWTTEGGELITLRILLKSQPISFVTMNLISNKPNEGIVDPAIHVIDPQEWLPDTPYEYKIIGVDDTKVDGDKKYQVAITAMSSDSHYNGPVATLSGITNYDAPTIRWVLPVGDLEVYNIESHETIRLKVKSVGNEPIHKVRFYRWVPPFGEHLIIGEDLYPPFKEFIDLPDIEYGYNQISAYAFGPRPDEPGEIQTFSRDVTIWLFRPLDFYLPLVFNP
jgi:hypothetical protein